MVVSLINNRRGIKCYTITKGAAKLINARLPNITVENKEVQHKPSSDIKYTIAKVITIPKDQNILNINQISIYIPPTSFSETVC